MPHKTLEQRRDAARKTLEQVEQDHVLHFYEQLDQSGRDQLLSQIEGIDWPEVRRLIESHVKHRPSTELSADIKPAPFYPRFPTDDLQEKYQQARRRGAQLVRQGGVAAFTVAGGQGTRLGWDGPKGIFPASPIRKAPLFQVLAEFIRKAQHKYQATIPWYVMTSPANDQPTRDFFEHNDHFGLDPANVMLFAQAMLPAIDAHTGGVLLAAQDSLALSPNGHGGSLKALHHSGALADMTTRGVEQISYVQVDNPNVKVVDPLFLGLHALDDAQMSSKMLPKTSPHEKVGNFALVDENLSVIEYSDFPDELADQRVDGAGEGGADGSGREKRKLRFRAGSIAIHVISVDFVASLNRGGSFSLPFHRADKKVSYVKMAGDGQAKAGEIVQPAEANAVKLETFVFDALPLCETSIVLETDRVEEFAPIKNADAPEDQPLVPDSATTSRRLQTARAARWLEAKGVAIPRDEAGEVEARIEIPHTTAIAPDDLDDLNLPDSLNRGSELLLSPPTAPDAPPVEPPPVE